jgi:hypothetical protein
MGDGDMVRELAHHGLVASDIRQLPDHGARELANPVELPVRQDERAGNLTAQAD